MTARRLSIKELPVEERPRERLIRLGAEKLSDAELLGIILGSGTVSESAVQIAQRILYSSGSLKNMAAMSIHELQQIPGIGPARAAQLKAALELARRHSREQAAANPRFSESKAVYRYCADRFRGKQQEEFWMYALNAKNQLVGESHVSSGTLMGSMVHPREVFHAAIRSSAAGVIVLHNHPSGDPEPSAEDRKVTTQLAEAGKVLGIPLLDHIIIGTERYYSFKDSGLI